MSKLRGFYAVPLAERTRNGLRGALPAPFVRLQSQEWLVGSAPSSIGTTERWYVNAFTHGNDLLWNAQTLLACQCAMGARPGVERLTVSWLPQEHLEYTILQYVCQEHILRGMNKPTTVRFTPQDKELIERIKELYGCPSDIAAIRLALRMVARGERGPGAQAPQKDSLISP